MSKQTIRTGLGEIEYVGSDPVPTAATNVQIALGSYTAPSAWLTPDAIVTAGSGKTARLLIGPGHVDPTAGRYWVWWRYTLAPEAPVEFRSSTSVNVVTDVGVPLDPAVHVATQQDVAAGDAATLAAANAYTDSHGGSGGARKVHHQTAAAAQWTVTHALGAYPSVDLVDAAGHGMDSDVDFPDDHTVIVTFSAPTAGYAVLT